MKKTYQAPAVERMRVEAQGMMALSIVNGPADGSTCYTEEQDKPATTGTNVWGEEW